MLESVREKNVRKKKMLESVGEKMLESEEKWKVKNRERKIKKCAKKNISEKKNRDWKSW